MNDAESYQNGNSLQKRDAIEILEEFSHKLNWSENGDRIIDIGCGDGSVTAEILRDYIPEFSHIIGCDISEKMVRFANENHKQKRIHFMRLDIEGVMPPELIEKFNHAFSFYTLHWIKHQKVAFKNIYNLLADGGDCLLTFLGHMPVFDAYRTLSRQNKWSSWLKDVEKYVSPYHDLKDPEEEVRRLMELTGFSNIKIKCQKKVFIYRSVESLKRAVAAVNPFKIPQNLFEGFMRDYLQVVKDMNLIDINNNNVKEFISVRTNYTLITVHATK